jgi:hypothetical protein
MSPVEDKLLNSNVSRTFYTQKLLPGAGARLDTLDQKPAGGKTAAAASAGSGAVAPKDFVRTNAADQKMDRFLVKSASLPATGEQQGAGSSGPAAGRECQLTSVKILRQQLQVS